MDDKMNNTGATKTDEHKNHDNPPETGEAWQDEETTQAKIAELESLLTERDEKLGLAYARVTELEQIAAGLDEKLTKAGDALSQAIASYRALVTESNPDIIQELITGDSIEEINESLEKGKTLIVKVRKGLEEENATIRVPAGAPQRTPLDLSILSPREKIQYAIGGK